MVEQDLYTAQTASVLILASHLTAVDDLDITRFWFMVEDVGPDPVIRNLSNVPADSHPKSLRIFLPRALRVVYDIRNNRDAAHLADGIDPNLQDATLVVSVLDWVLAELVRLSGGTSADHAHRLVEGIVTRKLPVVQDFDGHPKVLRTDLRAGELVLVLLFHVGPKGAAVRDVTMWIPETMRANVKRTLRGLEEKAFIHQAGDRATITYAGQRIVETRRLMEPV